MNRLAEDPWTGGIWIASEAGLFFKDLQDGNLRHYGYSDGLDHNKVRDVHVEPGRVWIATGGGVSVLEKGTQVISPVQMGSSRFEYAAQTVFVDERGAWIGTDSAGLFRVDPGTMAAVAVANPITGQPFQELVAGLGSTGAELFISATGYGLVIWNRDTGQASLHSQVYVQPKPMFGRILVLPDEVWIATQGDGIVRLSRSNGWKTSEFSSPDTTGAMTTYRPILVGNAVYMPTMSGAARYDRGTQSWRDWTSPELGGSANDLVLHEGVIYAATNFGDVRRYDRGRDSWHLEQWWAPGRILAQNTVRSCDQDGSLLGFGTMGGGANYYDPATGTWTQAGTFPWEQGKPDNIAIHAMDSGGGARYYGLSKGVSMVDTTTGQYRHFYLDGRVGEGRGHNPVVDISAEATGAWFATTASMQPRPRPDSPETWNLGGLVHLDRSTMTVHRFGKAQGLQDENLTSVLATSDRVFVGTRSAGLHVLQRDTGVFQPVPGVGLVNDLAIEGNTLWVAAAETGLQRVDLTTMTASTVPGWPGGAALSLLPHEGTLWVGTLFSGLHAYERESWTTIHSGRAVDALAFCMLADQGTLYLATGWGIERVALATRTFAPQITSLSLAASPGETQGPASNGAPTITISGLADLGSTLLATGTSKGPAGSKVEISWDDGPFLAAQGVAPWQATFPRPSPTGSAVIVARLVRVDGATLAETGTLVEWHSASDAPASAPGAFLTHSPLLDVDANLPLAFALGVDGGAVEARLELTTPDGDNLSVPFRAESDNWLIAEFAGFQTAGQASYRIVVATAGAQRTFPEPYSPHGARYNLTVHAYAGDMQAQVAARGPLAASPGKAREGAFYVNNVGSVPLLLDISFEGSAAGWVQGAPSNLAIPPGESTAVQFEIHAPAGSEGTKDLKVVLRAGGAVVATKDFDVETGVAAEGAPGLQLGLALALLALAVGRRRR